MTPSIEEPIKKEPSRNTESVGGTRAREALPSGWAPTHTDFEWLREHRSDLSEADIVRQNEAFRLYQREHRKRSFDWSARWRRWMQGARASDPEGEGGGGKRLGGGHAAAARAPIASEPWAQRLRSLRADLDAGKSPTMWARMRTQWGPPPGEPGCHAPADLRAQFGF